MSRGADWLAEDLVALALCWRVERRDGVTVALTDHDRDLIVDGLVHRASPGMTPSAIRQRCGFTADTMQIDGALASDAITEEDLLTGRWDGARVVLFGIDWSGGGGRVELGEGRLGAVSLERGGFGAELTGVVAALDRPVVEVTTPECRAELGDTRCRVAMAGRRRWARVVVADDMVLTLNGVSTEEDAYVSGRLRWFTGDNAGLESAIAGCDGATVRLRSPPPFTVVAGSLVELVEGCDKSLATCARRFGNAANFRGEPYLPGIDLLTRYPGG